MRRTRAVLKSTIVSRLRTVAFTKEVREGEMSHAEAARLHRDDHHIRQEERDVASQNGGHITRQEDDALNQQENRVSRQIGQ